MSAQKLDITRLGGQGDGIAETPQGQIFVPFTLPGDVVNAGVEKSRATLMSVLTPSPDRVTPPCPHFGHELRCRLRGYAGAAHGRTAYPRLDAGSWW